MYQSWCLIARATSASGARTLNTIKLFLAILPAQVPWLMGMGAELENSRYIGDKGGLDTFPYMTRCMHSGR